MIRLLLYVIIFFTTILMFLPIVSVHNVYGQNGQNGQNGVNGVNGVKVVEKVIQSSGEEKIVHLGPQLEYEDPSYDFGQVEMGVVVMHSFRYRNSGDEDLIVYFAKGGCTCVQVEYEKDTIAPGGTGEVTMIFNTSNRVGEEVNTLYLQANTAQKVHRAWFRGKILWPKGKDPNLK